MNQVKTFSVSWNIDIDAETPEQAARIALEIQRDPVGTATVFEVSDDDGVLGEFDTSEL